MALPIHRVDEHWPAAWASIAEQRGVELELLIVVNGEDPGAHAAARSAASGDPRVRVLHEPTPGISFALNRALREASHELVARMDGDDRSLPGRLAAQADALLDRPGLAALGTAYDVVDHRGVSMGVRRPPRDPGALRAALLCGNVLAHGSMMLRRSAVLAAGGYRPEAAEDYDLWLRLSRDARVGAIDMIGYEYRLRYAGRHSGTPALAESAARLMIAEWSRLPTDADPRVISALARGLSGDRTGPETREAIAAITAEAPTLAGLAAGLWSLGVLPETPHRVTRAMRRFALSRAGDRLRSMGAGGVIVWGDPEPDAWAVAEGDALGVPILGVAGGASASGFGPGAFVLIACAWREDQLWAESAAARARGARVLRLFGAEEPGVTPDRG